MTVDDARVRIEVAGFEITEEKRLPNDFGIQLKVNGPGFNGVSVSIYDKGTYLVQGNNKGKVETVLSQTPTSESQHSDSSTAQSIALAHAEPAIALPDSGSYESYQKRIFVVHGHDDKTRTELQLALLQLGLEPFVLANTSGGSLTIIEALEKEMGPGADRVRYGIVLLTPDDMGYSKAAGHEQARPRARQNVVLEMGMLISAIGRQNDKTSPYSRKGILKYHPTRTEFSAYSLNLT